MQTSPGYRTPLSETASIASARSSMFEDAPNSPDSWRFTSSIVKHLDTGSLEAQLQKCNLTTTYDAHPSQPHEPRTMRFPTLPALPKLPVCARNAMDKKLSFNMPVHSPSPSPNRGHKLARATSFQSLPKPQNMSVRRSISTSAVPRGPGFLQTLPTPDASTGRLKIKVRCPDEDEILAIKINKNKLRSVRELADVVSIKLNIRYSMRPDDLECRLVFPNKSLPAVELGSGGVDVFLEDFIMEYIQTRSKIYVEARLKPGRKRQNKVAFSEPKTDA